MRAYDYSDSLGTRRNVRNAGYFLKEKEIAWKFVNQHRNKILPEECPICRSRELKYMFQRWDVNYFICGGCSSGKPTQIPIW